MGRPVEGPPLITSTTTSGISAMYAKPRFSCLSEKPGPEVAVRDFLPAMEPPIAAAMPAISSSIWMNRPLIFGSSSAIISAISVDGVIG